MAIKLPDMGQMVGPLPLGAWAGVVAGGLGLAYVARRGSAPREEVEEDPSGPSFPATPLTSGPTRLNPIPYEPGAPVLTDNTEWIKEAVIRLVAKGFMPWKSQQCLASYLEGVIPSGDPNACKPVIEEAIRLVGPPPTGAPVNQFPITAPAPPKAPTVPKPAPAKPKNPCAGGGPVILYWYGNAMYLTNGKCRTQHGLDPRVADRYRRRYPAYGRPGHLGKVPRYNVLHQSISQTFSSTNIAPIP